MTGMPSMQLFDLTSDPGEENNLVSVHPDRVEKMKTMLQTVIDNGRTTTGKRLANDVEIVMVKPVAKPKRKK
jgi:hypothetical protein